MRLNFTLCDIKYLCKSLVEKLKKNIRHVCLHFLVRQYEF